jgi:FkbM family methyltransferase
MGLAQTVSFIWNHPIGRRRRLASLVRFVTWQCRSRLRPGPHLQEFVGGANLLVRKGQTGATGNIYVGLHEFEDMAFVVHALRPGDLFLDVGANIGSYTVLAAKVSGAAVVAVEPVPSTYEALVANIDVNEISTMVEAVNCGLARLPGELKFTVGNDTTNHVVTEQETNGNDTVSVSVATFDELTRLRCPLLAKIDVEGFESEVLAGARRTLSNPSLKGLILELNGSGEHYGYSDEAIFFGLRDIGFEPYRYDPFTRALSRLDGPNKKGGNTLFLKDATFFEKRVREAQPIDVRRTAL